GFQKRWGIYSPVYEQILRTTNKANIRNVALNAPDDLARKIARGEPLTAEETAMLPSGFAADEGGYKNFVAMMGEHPGVNETDRRRYFDAQNAWDETMADRILEFKRRNPKLKLLVFTGRDHVSGGYGIPFYVSQKADLKQLVLFPKGRLDLGPGQKAI
ncbi:MAG: ChaN family lipoprotein, partial [Verrucomicrobia bacterium]|nr:ChaN family lipoprotein [Verrucomicrobiota bacterium]